MNVVDFGKPDSSCHRRDARSRDRIGLVQYRLSEHLGIPINRLKNLETGHFRAMPRESEIRLLSELYGFDYNFLEEKAVEFLREKRKGKEPRRLNENLH